MDLAVGSQLKESGIARAASGASDVLDEVRTELRRIARIRESREVTADDATLYLIAAHGGMSLGNAAGALFRNGDWEFTGRWQASAKETNHAHENRIWRLKPGR